MYLAYSDECGSYISDRTVNFKRRHPFYIRATVLINDERWRDLRANVSDLRRRFDIDVDAEVKWSHLWRIREARKHGADSLVRLRQEIGRLADADPDLVCSFVEESIAATIKSGAQVLYSITDNSLSINYPFERLAAFHIQNHMQRLQMHMDEQPGVNLCSLFVDSVDDGGRDANLRNAYRSIYSNGDFIKEYSNLHDSLAIVYSHQSLGTQLADFFAGAFAGLLRGGGNGSLLVKRLIWPAVRRSSSGEPWGYGVWEVPTDRSVRMRLSRKVRSNMDSAC